MSKLQCHCGHLISDSEYPCPWSGELRWENESELQSEKTINDVKDFLATVEKGKYEEWIKTYFEEDYPLDLEIAVVIDDIYSKVKDEQGHSVLQCPECERIYLQKEFFTNEWVCFEKRNE